MAITDYNANPSLNTSIAGIDISENCPASGFNNALRQIMADLKAFSATLPSTPIGRANGGTGVAATDPATGKLAFTTLADAGGRMGAPLGYLLQGAYPHFASTSVIDPRIHVQAMGTDPTSNPGDIVFEY